MKRKSRPYLSGYYDEIEAAVAPLSNRPQRVNLWEYLNRERECDEHNLLARRIKSALQKFDWLYVNHEALSILASWNCELDRVQIQGLVRGYLAGKKKILEQLRIRRSLVYFLNRLGEPSISLHLQKQMNDDCTEAIKSLTIELECYNKVLSILKRHGAQTIPQRRKALHKTKPRDSSTAQTVRQLHIQLASQYPSRNARAKIIHQLLEIVDPRHAPQSSASIRTGYR